jgi:formate dehydrogenase major subunit
METIKLTINGQEVEAQPGRTILEVVRENELDDIPTLCHSPELEPYGSCFLCVVEVKGRWNLLPACATRVTDGMEIETSNERVISSRKTALALLLSNHYADCVSPCLLGCPAGVDAQGYIALAAMGLYREAADLIRRTNPLPAICGRVCVRKCEVACRRVDVDSPVGINAVKRFITDAPGVYDGTPERKPSTGKTIGIVGAGPAGLTAAWFLGLEGHKPVLYEAMEKAGGMLRYGIPEYRLTDEVLDAEIDYICKAGAEIRTCVRIGEEITLDQLRKEHDAVFLGAGAWTGKPMRVEGEFETEGIVSGVDFLVEKAIDPTPVSGTIVVVGGGNTAMDVARTAWRLGADKVIVLYRRTKKEMPADEMEIEDCLHEGIEIMELAAPVGIIADEGGRLQALRCIRMKLGEPDSSGRRRPVPMEGSEFDLPCDLGVAAIGQNTVLEGLTRIGGEDIELTRWNTYVVDTVTMATNRPGVFAGGDAADDGPTVVIDAIRDGQRAARSIQAYLTDSDREESPFVVEKEFWGKPGMSELGDVVESPRHEVHQIPVDERRGSFVEVATGFEYEDTMHEAERCLSCGCVRYDDCDLRLYAEEYGVDMEEFAGYARKHKVDDRHPYLVYDPNKCILCSRCVRTCGRVLPVSALGLVNRGFRTEVRPSMNDPLVETNCVVCGNCVDSCPTGALTVKYPFPGRASLDTVDTANHCAFCSLACPQTVKAFGDDRYFIGPSGVPGEYLCRYGRFGIELFLRQKRLSEPVVRTADSVQAVTLADACDRAAERLGKVIEQHGPESTVVLVSPEFTNEEMFLASRIAREGLGTANIGSLAIMSTGNESGALDDILGFTASTSDRSVLRDADLIVCNNTSVEADHLILAVEIQEAVRGGANLIVASSVIDQTDEMLSEVALDPMRGRSAILWSGVLGRLVESGFLGAEDVSGIDGSDELLSSMRERDTSSVSDLTGVETADIERTAELLSSSARVVFVHSPDRPQDQAPGDMEMLANLVLLLRGKGVRADLLLPRMIANSAGLEVSGADPAFLPGRKDSASAGLPGATSQGELLSLLESGSIRAAVVLGEDPMRHNRSASYLSSLEFLLAMDWTDTETTRYADIVLPGSTFLESPGTRCNFEGRLVHFGSPVSPPAGFAGWEALANLAQSLGVDGIPASGGSDALTVSLESAVRGNLGDLTAFYWNEGEERSWPEAGRLVTPDVMAKPSAIQPPLTHSERYKREIAEVGTERFRII